MRVSEWASIFSSDEKKGRSWFGKVAEEVDWN